MIVAPVHAGERCFLEICIPTYNRSRQLSRLLTALEREIGQVSAATTLRIAISDNCSPDDTQAMLASHPLRDRFVVRRHPSNIGPLLNIWSLYEHANADYVWVLGDDDMPKPGSLAKILRTLSAYSPAVLTFEFEQPLGSTTRRHGNRSGIEEITDLGKAVPHLLILGKLTKYVTSGAHLPRVLDNVRAFKDTGYGWLMVILEALALDDRRTVALDHECLAECDENYTQVTDGLTPRFWDDYLLLLDHRLVTEYCQAYADLYRRRHGPYIVRLIYAVLAGVMKTEATDLFRQKGKTLRFEIGYCRNPFVLFEWLSLRWEIPASSVACEMEERVMEAIRRMLEPVRRGPI